MTSRYPPLEEIFPALKPAKARETRPNPKNLKDAVRSDLSENAVWFNSSELAGYHVINGAGILCVFDRYEAVLATGSGRATDKGAAVKAGLQSDLYLLFIRADEYGGNPRVGQEITVDGRKLRVKGHILYDGVYEITLEGDAAR
ncbi:MAG: hypothetical protein LBS75_03490 [Synergistaceae bacterium]|jgi:hypothetical protein|nr:hypothetical protein [Synergistaceae bacterium]